MKFFNQTSVDMFQSSFRAHHSTEMALMKVVNDIRLNLDSKKLTVLVLLELLMQWTTKSF